MRTVLILLFFLMSYLSASNTFIVTDHKSSYNLSPHMQIFEDKSANLTYEEVSSKDFEENFKPSTESIPKFGFTNSVIWLKQTVRYERNNDVHKEWLLSLEYPLLDYISLYVEKNHETIQTFHSGDKLPFNQRAFDSRFFRFPLMLEPDQDLVIYWRIQSESSIHVPLILTTFKEMNISDQKEMLVLGIFYGILLLLFLYNLVSFFIIGDKSYLYYVFFVFSYSLMQITFDGLGIQYIWPGSDWLINDALAAFVGMSVISAIMLGQIFLDSKTNTPKLHHLLNGIIIIALVALVLSPFSLYTVTIKIVTGLAIITPILLMILGFITYRMGYRLARLYLISWIVFFLATMLLAFNKFGFIPSHWIVDHAQQFGVLIKVFVLSIALGMRMYYLAFHDNLTGLGNRNALDRVVNRAIFFASRKKKNFSIMFLDLDDFKDVNDSMGHAAGDLLLKKLAIKLKKRLRSQDTLIRQGGDEFIIIFEDLHNEAHASKIASEILSLIHIPLKIKDKEIHITASLGIACYPEDGKDADTLIKNADAAMFKAKEKGKNRFYFFNKELDKAAQLRLNILNDLHHALKNKEFVLYYQPQISTATQKIIGLEALIRWNHPTRGFLSPDMFISDAERTDIIIDIGKWVIEDVCQQIEVWKKSADFNFICAINISVKQFMHSNFIDDLNRILEKYSVTPQEIELEITESLLVKNIQKAIEIMNRLHKFGFNIAIDDFGTGYSSFSYMRNFTIDTIKIDKSFIDSIKDDKQSRIITQAMIKLGHIMKMKVIAEGVENEHQLNLLKKMDCDIIQGFYYDKPMLADSFAKKYIYGE